MRVLYPPPPLSSYRYVPNPSKVRLLLSRSSLLGKVCVFPDIPQLKALRSYLWVPFYQHHLDLRYSAETLYVSVVTQGLVISNASGANAAHTSQKPLVNTESYWLVLQSLGHTT